MTNSGAQNGTTQYLLDGVREIEEHNDAGTLTQQYVFGTGTDEPLVFDRNLVGGRIANGPGNQRLFYDRAQYLNTVQDRFLQRNPVGAVVPGSNLYAYAMDEPTQVTDPTRLQPGRTCLDIYKGTLAICQLSLDFCLGRAKTAFKRAPCEVRYKDCVIKAEDAYELCKITQNLRRLTDKECMRGCHGRY